MPDEQRKPVDADKIIENVFTGRGYDLSQTDPQTLADLKNTIQRMADTHQDLIEIAEQGDPEDQYELALYYENQEDFLDDAKYWYLEAVKQGHAKAGYNLARLLYKEKNYSLALQYFEMNAEKVSQSALMVGALCLGDDYKNVIPRNPEKGLFYLTMASNTGYYPASQLLGDYYRKGEGLPQDDGKALHW